MYMRALETFIAVFGTFCFSAKGSSLWCTGKEHPDVATELKNVADFYEKIGQQEKADSFRASAAAILKKAGVHKGQSQS